MNSENKENLSNCQLLKWKPSVCSTSRHFSKFKITVLNFFLGTWYALIQITVQKIDNPLNVSIVKNIERHHETSEATQRAIKWRWPLSKNRSQKQVFSSKQINYILDRSAKITTMEKRRECPYMACHTRHNVTSPSFCWHNEKRYLMGKNIIIITN